MSERVEKLFNLVKSFKETYDALTPEEQIELDELMKNHAKKTGEQI